MPKRKLAPAEHLVAGTAAGLVSTAALFPLDTIKVRYQVDEATTLRAPQRLVGAFKSVLQKEGTLGLYQGLPAGLYGSGISWGGYFYFYELSKSRWVASRAPGEGDKWNAAWHQTAAAIEAGAIMVALTNPIWLVKTRMQLQLRVVAEATAAPMAAASGVGVVGGGVVGGGVVGGGVVGGGVGRSSLGLRPYRSFWDALATIVREEGPLALYKGSLPALLLTSHGAVQFVVYEALKADASAKNLRLGTPGVLAMGAASKIVAALATYPLQVCAHACGRACG